MLRFSSGVCLLMSVLMSVGVLSVLFVVDRCCCLLLMSVVVDRRC